MEYGTFSPEQARKFEGLLRPELRTDDNFDDYLYFAAFDDEKGVVALAAVDATEEGPKLLSIGVSPLYGGQRIGSTLLASAYTELQLRYAPLLEKMPLIFSAEDIRSAEDWDDLDNFLELNGFDLVQTMESSRVTVGEILKTKSISFALKRTPVKEVVALKDLPGQTLRVFNNDCAQNNRFPKIDPKDYAQDVSMFYVKDGKVDACILSRQTGEKNFDNEWTYLAPDAEDKAVLLMLIAQCASRAEEIYGADTFVSFLPVNYQGKRLYEKLFPEREARFEIRTYERPLTAIGSFVRSVG